MACDCARHHAFEETLYGAKRTDISCGYGLYSAPYAVVDVGTEIKLSGGEPYLSTTPEYVEIDGPLPVPVLQEKLKKLVSLRPITPWQPLLLFLRAEFRSSFITTTVWD